MPPSTSKREPIIVYVPRALKEKLEAIATLEDRTLSALCARLLERAAQED